MSKKKEYIIDMRAEQLLDYLDRKFPVRCIGPNETEVSAHRYAGARELIDNLRARLNREKENYGITTQEAL